MNEEQRLTLLEFLKLRLEKHGPPASNVKWIDRLISKIEEETHG